MELTRSEANEELTYVMQGYEEHDAAYCDDRYHEKQRAPRRSRRRLLCRRDRKQEIREQIKQPQSGIARQHKKRRQK